MSLDSTVRIGRNPFRHALINGNHALTTGGLAIKAAASAIVKTVSTVYSLIYGTTVKTVAADMPALAGTVVNATFNVFVFFVNEAGVTRTAMGTAGATIGAVVYPARLDGEAVIGYIIVNPTGTGNFVGGTTALDDVTIVPNVVYINTPFAFDPTWSKNCDE